MKKVDQKAAIGLTVFLSGLLISIILIIFLLAIWIVGNLPTEQVMEILRQPQGLTTNWQQWMESGYGWPGFRYLVSILLHEPLIMTVLLFALIMAISSFVLIGTFFYHLRKEKERLKQKLERSSLHLEREAKKIKINTKTEDNHEVLNLSNESILQNFSAPVIQTQSKQDEFLVLEMDEALLKKEENELKLFLHLIAEGQQTREGYEDVLHQVSSKLSSLYFLLDDLASDPKIAEDTIMQEDFSESEKVLDECSNLLKSALHHSVYEQFRIDRELLLCVNQKKPEIDRKHLKTTLQLDSISIWGNAIWLRQVFETLLANAIECAPKNSLLGISCKLEYGKIRIQFDNEMEMITSESEPHESLNDSSRRYQTKRTGHFGIGQDLVEKVLRAHQGHLETKQENGIYQAIILIPYSEFDYSNS